MVGQAPSRDSTISTSFSHLICGAPRVAFIADSHSETLTGQYPCRLEVRSETCSVLPPFSSVAQCCLTICSPMESSTLGFTVHHQLPELDQTHVHQVGDAIQPSNPLSSPLLLPSVFPSIRVFTIESALPVRWPKYWSYNPSVAQSGSLAVCLFVTP